MPSMRNRRKPGRGERKAFERRENATVKQLRAERYASPSRWPGLCPRCGAKLTKYAVHTNVAKGRRGRYWKCGRCQYRTYSKEHLVGPPTSLQTTDDPSPTKSGPTDANHTAFPAADTKQS